MKKPMPKKKPTLVIAIGVKGKQAKSDNDGDEMPSKATAVVNKTSKPKYWNAKGTK